ncbi:MULTISPECIES: anti-sigma factor family protein [Streptomyces]|uniref:anti-sigma factor family protein n=1 Tax=Streptomyces TaxID=1883 RepID=UPI00224929CF|nr:hypothetical protein [Streptomyces sp. JHD 1]MCX2967964.1 hypothetical protein [Streptomyces sp. JHD 1]
MTAPFAGSGPDGHPEVDELSALSEGLLPPQDTVAIRRHLALCPLCADVLSSLEEIRSALGTLPGPVRMPEDVAGRIDAALAAEAFLDASPVREDAAAPIGGTDRHTHGSRREEASVLAAPAPHVSRETTRRTPGGPSSTSGPGHAGPGATGPGRAAPGRRRSRSGRRRAALWGVAGALAAAVAGGVVVPTLFSSSDPNGPTEAARPHASGTAELESRVHELLADSPAAAPGRPGGDRTASGEAEGQQAPNAPFTAETAPTENATVPPCVQQGTGRTESPLAATKDTYEGTVSYLVLLPHPGDETRVDAYMVDAACATGASEGPGERLAFLTVERR